MSRPRIVATDEQIGFHWATVTGRPVSLPDLVRLDHEPERLVPTHLEALDDVLIDAASRFGEVLGGARPAQPRQRPDLRRLHRALERLNYEYAAAAAASGLPVEIRGGQIVGTSALIAVRARMALGEAGPWPLEGQLRDPRTGVVAGYGRLEQVDPSRPWCGGRWVVHGQDGARFPLTLSTLLFDSSGVNKEAALVEHQEALRGLIAASGTPAAEPSVVAGALEWLLYDWLMAHRESPGSGAVVIRQGREGDAEMIVAAAAALAQARARLDPGLLSVPG